jgi:hypothetical protein
LHAYILRPRMRTVLSRHRTDLSAARATIVAAVIGATALVSAAFLNWGLPRLLGGNPQPKPKVVAVVARDESFEQPAQLDVKMANFSGEQAYFTQADVVIDDVVALAPCATEGAVPSSADYDAVLPAHRGEVPLALSQSIPAHGDDRFTLRFTMPSSDQSTNDMFIYRFHVDLFHDGARNPVRTPEVVLGMPDVPDVPEYWANSQSKPSAMQATPTIVLLYGEAGVPRVTACWARNLDLLRRAKAWQGTRSSALAATLQAASTP